MVALYVEDSPLRVWRARYAVKLALKDGRLVKTDRCQVCADKYNRSGKVYGHHHWGYDIENELRVVWLCSSCHALCHMQNH